MEVIRLNMETTEETTHLEDTPTSHLETMDKEINNKTTKMITIHPNMEAKQAQIADMAHTLHKDLDPMIDKTAVITTQTRINRLRGTHHKHGSRQDNLFPKDGSKLRNT
jgi:hypothetical protein